MPLPAPDVTYIRWFADLGLADLPLVGGKNASLGELYRALAPMDVRVPPGFAITADAYRHFLREAHLDQQIPVLLRDLNTHDLANLRQRGRQVRHAILAAPWPAALADAIVEAYACLSADSHVEAVDVAVRSSATAEDLPDASFAGQQETYLNVQGDAALLDACKRCFASLFTDRALSYRADKGFDQVSIALSVGVQRMVRAALAASGVMFSLDTETGFRTNRGGRTCHAAIVSRELGVPAVVGTEHGTDVLRDGQLVTMSCAEGETGMVYDGALPFTVERVPLTDLPRPTTRVMLNIGNPDEAFALSFLPNDGVGLAREEFIISNFIKVHPLALLDYEYLDDPELKAAIDRLTVGYTKKAQFFVELSSIICPTWISHRGQTRRLGTPTFCGILTCCGISPRHAALRCRSDTNTSLKETTCILHETSSTHPIRCIMTVRETIPWWSDSLGAGSSRTGSQRRPSSSSNSKAPHGCSGSSSTRTT
jgi:phosphoenolpyruvate synthase/pyruvate phosphate dikinase